MSENNGFDLSYNGEETIEKQQGFELGGSDNKEPQGIYEPRNRGLTIEEEKDPNKIHVVISDPSPIVIMFGPGQSGKTMTLVRLTRWLKQNGYKVEPDRTFRPSNSTTYQEMCDSFHENVNSNYAAKRTKQLNFMLIKVMNKYGEPICQILEAPGEHYFDEDHPKRDFPLYINNILPLPNPKTWMFIVESNWKDASDRQNYADKIKEMQSRISFKDRVIFTCHKADIQTSLFDRGVPNVKQFFKNIYHQYPGIFTKYENRNPISRLWRKYNFDFVVFSAGFFNDTIEGGKSYAQSNDMYPANLWKAIIKTVKGGW